MDTSRAPGLRLTLRLVDAATMSDWLQRIGFTPLAQFHDDDGTLVHAEYLWPQDEEYGGRGSTVRDPEGNLWSFGTYRPGGG